MGAFGGSELGTSIQQIRFMSPDMSHTPGSLWLTTKRQEHNVQTAIQWREPRRILSRSLYAAVFLLSFLNLMSGAVMKQFLVARIHLISNVQA